LTEAKVNMWLKYAMSDLKIARLGMAYAKEETAQICFHPQQCVEKSLKAFLIHKNISFPKTHSIEYLYKNCKDIEPDFDNIDTGNLSSYAVETRYPQDFVMPDLKEADDAYMTAKQIFSFIVKKLDSDQDLTLF